MKKYFKLIISLLIPLMIGSLSGLFNSSDTIWYQELIKPAFNPPGWVFGPVWTILYLMIGLAFYYIWTSEKEIKLPTIFYSIQLCLNFVWSFLFFGLMNPLLAFVDIVLLWIFIIVTMFLFYKVSKKSTYLLIPYLLWVTFAAILNFTIYYLN